MWKYAILARVSSNRSVIILIYTILFILFWWETKESDWCKTLKKEKNDKKIFDNSLFEMSNLTSPREFVTHVAIASWLEMRILVKSYRWGSMLAFGNSVGVALKILLPTTTSGRVGWAFRCGTPSPRFETCREWS